jgi:hypothetical protein
MKHSAKAWCILSHQKKFDVTSTILLIFYCDEKTHRGMAITIIQQCQFGA